MVKRMSIPSAALAAALLVAPAPAARGGPTLTEITPMEAPRAAHTASTLADGTVLVAGGMGSVAEPIAGSVRFDPVTGRFRPTGAMGTRRFSHSATVLGDGRVLLVGGYGEGNSYLASAELYDPATGRFTPTGAMAVPRADHVAVLLLSLIHI